MKWWSHIAIAAAPCAVFAPELVPVAVAGATAPDWMEYASAALGRRLPHRGITHYGAWWGAATAAAVALSWWPAVAFFAGGLSHWFADALTPTGVPLSSGSRARVHFFGGRIRTGSAQEYIVSGVWAGAWVIASHIGLGGDSANPWLMPWADLYKTGVMDLHEWRAARWQFL